MASRRVWRMVTLLVAVIVLCLISLALLESRRTLDWQSSLIDYFEYTALAPADGAPVHAAFLSRIMVARSDSPKTFRCGNG